MSVAGTSENGKQGSTKRDQKEALADGQACLEAALRYRQLGWSALIVCPPDHHGVGKTHGKNCKSPGKAPWGPWKEFQERIATERELRDRWHELPNANVGIALGPVSRLIRVDSDGPGGEAKLQELSHGDLPPTLEFTSGRPNGGRGLLYAIPDGVELRTTSEREGQKEELRFQAKGSQTVLPPSRHWTGTQYSWVEGHRPGEIEIAPAPAWLLRELAQKHRSNGDAKILAKGEKITEGGRNTRLFSYAGTMQSRGMCATAIMAAMIAENEENCDPPLEDSEVESLVQSVLRYPPGTQPSPNGHPPPKSEPWEPPIPFAEFPRPPFPVECYSVTIVTIVTKLSHATQTPLALAAMLYLGIAAAGLAGKFKIKARDGWAEPVNLYVVVILDVAERKTAVFGEMIAPVQQYEAEEIKRLADKIAEKCSERRILEGRLKNVEAKAAKASNPAEIQKFKEEARGLARDLRAFAVPVEPQAFADDVTPEELVRLMDSQGGRMLVASDEGAIFEIALGRYSEKGRPNLEVFLKGHAGKPIRVNRVGRGKDWIDEPALSLALTVQPDVVEGLMQDKKLRGRGFLARPLYAIPHGMVGHRQPGAAPVSAEQKSDYHDLMKRLWQLPGNVDEDGKPCAHWLELSPDADEELKSFERWLEPKLKKGGELEHLKDWAGKLAGAAVRISGVLHMTCELDGGSDKGWNRVIGLPRIQDAIRIAKEYLIPHAQAAFGLMGADASVERAKRLLEWIRQKDCKTFSRRDAHRGIQHYIQKAEQLEPVLKLLVAHGYIREQAAPTTQGKGRTPSPTFESNPCIWEQNP